MSNFIVCRTAPSDPCGMCLDALNNGASPVVCHEGENGKKHPYHKKCLRDWLIRLYDAQEMPQCPTCKEVVNMRSLYSWVEWNSLWIKDVAYHGLVAAAIPLASSTAGMMDLFANSRSHLCGKLHGAVGGMFGGIGALAMTQAIEGNAPVVGILAGISMAGASRLESHDRSSECGRLVVTGSTIGALVGAVALCAERKIAEYMQWPVSDRRAFLIGHTIFSLALSNLGSQHLFNSEELLPFLCAASVSGGLVAAIFRALPTDWTT